MSSGIPPRTREEQIAYHNEVIRQNELGRPKVRFSRATRRLLVAFMYVVMSVLVFGHYALSGGFTNFGIPLSNYWIVPLIPLWVVVFSVGGLGQWTGRQKLDEHERAVGDQATATAYAAVFIGIFLLLVDAIAVNYKLGLPVPPLDFYLVWPLFWLAGSLPQAILAWTLPDPAPDTSGRLGSVAVLVWVILCLAMVVVALLVFHGPSWVISLTPLGAAAVTGFVLDRWEGRLRRHPETEEHGSSPNTDA